jgi:hypothetical protein
MVLGYVWWQNDSQEINQNQNLYCMPTGKKSTFIPIISTVFFNTPFRLFVAAAGGEEKKWPVYHVRN